MTEETLIYTDSRPRAKSTGHAFGFEGNLGMPVVVSALISVLLLTLLFGRTGPFPLPLKLVIALLPLLLTICYIAFLRSRKPPRYDRDLFISLVNGHDFQLARIQPRHPYLPLEGAHHHDHAISRRM
jgi:hypothetical protein